MTELSTQSKTNLFNRIVSFVSSIYFVPVIFAVAFCAKHLGFYYFSIPFFAMVITFILIFCKDVKNIFAILFYACFFIDNIFDTANWVSYGLAIGIAVSSFAFFVIKDLIMTGANLKDINVWRSGTLYIPLIVSSIAFLLGGIFINFKPLIFLTVLGFCLVAIMLYYIALNHTKELSKYLLRLFVMGAVLIIMEMLFTNFVYYGEISKIFSSSPTLFIGSQNVNVASLFMLLGLVGCFGLGHKTRFDWVSLLLGCFIILGILLTSCRTCIALGGVLFCVFVVVCIVDSPNKLPIGLLSLALLIGVVSFVALSKSFQENVIKAVVNKFSLGTNGRSVLWKWCFDRFKENPIFGYGFVGNEVVPTLNAQVPLVLAHNTVIQWLCSLGTVGTALMCYFYYYKYKIVLKDFFGGEMFLRTVIIVIALSGFVDQAAAMDTFIYLISIISLAGLEKTLTFSNPKNKTKKKLFNKR